MNALSDAPVAPVLRRDAVTWYGYLLLGYFTYLISIQGNILPFLRVELDLSFRAVSLHTSAIACGGIIVGLIGDRVVRRFGRRVMFPASVLGSAAAVVLLTFASTTWASIGASFLFGLMGAFLPAMMPALMSDIHGSQRDIAFAEMNAVAYVFSIMAPVLTGLFVWLGWGWRPAIYAGAAVGVIVVLTSIHRTLPESPDSRGSMAAPLSAAFWWFWGVLGLGVAVEFSVLLWAPAFLERVVGLSAASAAFTAAAFFAGMMIGRLAGSTLIGAFGTRLPFFGATATTLVGFVAYWVAITPTISVIGLFVIGLGVALLFPLALSMAISAAGGAADRASARTMLAPGIAILVSPPLLGMIADGASLKVAQAMTAGFMVLAFLAFLAGETARRRQPA